MSPRFPCLTLVGESFSSDLLLEKTARKTSKYGVFSVPHFPVFGHFLRSENPLEHLRWRFSSKIVIGFKDTQTENIPSKKTVVRTKSMSKYIWA